MDQSQPRTDPDLLRKLEGAVGSMPRISREIFLAHRIDNMTYREIADVTGLTVRQVERHIAKALAHITKHLDSAESHGRVGLLRLVLRLPTKFFGGETAPRSSKNSQGA